MNIARCKANLRLAFGILLLLLYVPASAEAIRVLYDEGVDSIGDYCMGALKLALSQIDHNYEIETVQGDRTSARAMEDVRQGELSMVWGAPDEKVEEMLLPIRIPLYKGLLGYRIMIIRKGDQARFDNVRTLEDLKKISLGQGVTWGDTKVLTENGLSVVKVHKYQAFFHMLDGGRFDAFPRGLQEPWREIAAHPELPLTVEKNLMLVYKMPFYLFVSRDNPKLAADIERGFNIAIANGSFDDYFFSDPTIKEALEKADVKNRIPIYLENQSLPKKTPVDRPELWLDPQNLR